MADASRVELLSQRLRGVSNPPVLAPQLTKLLPLVPAVAPVVATGVGMLVKELGQDNADEPPRGEE
jgi:hypothetical protein